jgi:hypothetical protein
MLKFDEASHVYKYEGKVIPSVTTVLKHQGAGVDYSAIPAEVLKKAADRGTEVHRIIENYYKDGDPMKSPDKDVNKFLKGARNFAESGVFQCLHSEEKLFCDIFWFAGTVDLIGLVDGELSVVDAKTTSRLHRETVEYQLALYEYLAERFVGERVLGRYALHLTPNTKDGYSLVRLNDNPRARVDGLKMVMEYNKMNGVY